MRIFVPLRCRLRQVKCYVITNISRVFQAKVLRAFFHGVYCTLRGCVRQGRCRRMGLGLRGLCQVSRLAKVCGHFKVRSLKRGFCREGYRCRVGAGFVFYSVGHLGCVGSACKRGTNS